MAYEAYDRFNKEIDISDGLNPSLDINADYYCKGCDCVLHIKAVDSNVVATHFAGKHEPWCDNVQLSKTKERISDYRFNKDSLQEFLDMLQSDDVKIPTASSDHGPRQTTTTTGAGTGAKPTRDIKDIKSLRQLFNLFKREASNTILYDDVRICDVYCGPSTKHIYTKYVTGIHLVHAQYNWYSKTKPILYFRFPSIDECTIKITAIFSDEALYRDAVKLLYHHYKRPVLLFADFVDGTCTVSALSQIVPL